MIAAFIAANVILSSSLKFKIKTIGATRDTAPLPRYVLMRDYNVPGIPLEILERVTFPGAR